MLPAAALGICRPAGRPAHRPALLPCCCDPVFQPAATQDPHNLRPPCPPTLSPACRAIDVLACPAGFYCPTPAAALPCEPGYFCPPATIQPVTCNMSLLVEAAPLMPITFRPATVAQRVFLHGDPLQGNSCPANASDPIRLCPKGQVRGLHCRHARICPVLTGASSGWAWKVCVEIVPQGQHP